jgi:transglutaminase-like putative cysteine protease
MNTLISQKVKYLFLFFCLFSTVTLAENGPDYSVNLIPKELLENAHTVVRQEDYKIEIPSYDKIVESYRAVITILKEESDANEMRFAYNSFSKINKIKGSVYDADGNLIREIKKKDINDRSAVYGSTMYSDSRFKWINFNHPTYPYTIEIEYKKTTSRFMYYPGWLVQDFGVAIERAKFTVVTKELDNLNYKTVNIEQSPTKGGEGDQFTLSWIVEQKKAIKQVSYSVPANEILPRVLLAPKEFKLGKYKGQMNNWKDFGLFINKLNRGRDVLSPKMKKEVLKLTASAKSDQEKIDILYKYLQDNTRYISVQIGVGGWQTFDADYVEKNKYGDCKALTNFMKAMLNAVDVTAYPVYIGSGRDDALIKEEFVYPSFNHVILNVPSEDYWLECTSSYSPPNYIGASNANRMALRVTEEGGELVKTPSFTPEESKETNKTTIMLSENGDAIIVNDCSLSGPRQGRLRYVSYEKTKKELEEEFLESCGLPSVSIAEYNVEPLLDKPVVKINYDIDVRKYAIKSGKRFFVPLNAINKFTSVPDKIDDRKEPIMLKEGYMLEDELSLVLPEGYEIESMPDENVLLESSYGVYEMELKLEDSILKYKRTLKMLALSLPATEYEEFRNFRKEVAELDNAKLVLVKKKGTTIIKP